MVTHATKCPAKVDFRLFMREIKTPESEVLDTRTLTLINTGVIHFIGAVLV